VSSPFDSPSAAVAIDPRFNEVPSTIDKLKDEIAPLDTERKKSASFEREDGATRHVTGRNYLQARTANGLDA
jgi:hypothetical protein